MAHVRPERRGRSFARRRRALADAQAPKRRVITPWGALPRNGVCSVGPAPPLGHSSTSPQRASAPFTRGATVAGNSSFLSLAERRDLARVDGATASRHTTRGYRLPRLVLAGCHTASRLDASGLPLRRWAARATAGASMGGAAVGKRSRLREGRGISPPPPRPRALARRRSLRARPPHPSAGRIGLSHRSFVP